MKICILFNVLMSMQHIGKILKVLSGTQPYAYLYDKNACNMRDCKVNIRT